MTESQILANLKALGARDVTSKAQERNGTTCFTLPTGDCISEHKTGYIEATGKTPLFTKDYFPQLSKDIKTKLTFNTLKQDGNME